MWDSDKFAPKTEISHAIAEGDNSLRGSYGVMGLWGYGAMRCGEVPTLGSGGWEGETAEDVKGSRQIENCLLLAVGYQLSAISRNLPVPGFNFYMYK